MTVGCKSPRCLAAWLVFALAAGAFGQCTVPSLGNDQVSPVWGGETWATFSEEVGGALRIWHGEDGGRIRTSLDNGATWVFADTPDDFSGSIFDIWFFPGGDHGFAVGRQGRVLETTDAGLTWSDFGPRVLDAAGEPATLWGVRAFANGTVLVSGLWTFKFYRPSFTNWVEFQVYDGDPSNPASQLIPQSDLELFRLDLIGDAGGFVGGVGGEWEEASGGHGVVLFTDSAVPAAAGGLNWWITLDDGAIPVSPSGAVMLQPWSLRYERDATSTTASVGYVIGGRGGNNPSRWYRTTDSGRTWALDGESPVTMYDVASTPGGNAMIVGYSGRYTLRDPATGNWTLAVMPSNSSWFPTPFESTGALLGASSFGNDGLIAVGDFGTQRCSLDYGATWNPMSVFYPNADELEQRLMDCAFVPSLIRVGCVTGQFGRILRTTDGGCNWADVQPVIGEGLNAIALDEAGQGVAVGNRGTIYSSVDTGTTWSAGTIAGPFLTNCAPADMTLTDVELSGGAEAFAVGYCGGRPVVLRSPDGGANWSVAATPTSGNLKLRGIAFISPTEALLVGDSNASGNRRARAFTVAVSGSTVTYAEVPLGLPGPHSLLASVDAVGSSLATATAYAAGDDGLVMEWNGSTFVVPSLPVPTAIDLVTVGMSPSGSTVLIGGRYDEDLATADDKGFLLRKDTSGWTRVRANTGKDIEGISLITDTAGYVLGQAGGPSASFINGNLASSCFLRYIAQ